MTTPTAAIPLRYQTEFPTANPRLLYYRESLPNAKHVSFFLPLSLPCNALMDVIIFAAGRGERLRPLTDKLPKPLIKINGLSLIEIHLYRLAEAGFSRVIINLHHLGGMIRSKLGNGRRYGLEIFYSDEPGHALETAGGIVHALPLIHSERFAAISADVLCDYDLRGLINTDPAQSGYLVLVDNPAHHPGGDFALDQGGLLRSSLNSRGLEFYTFSGIACFQRSLFENLPAGKRALRPVLEEQIAARRLRGEHYSGIWSDIGSPLRLEQARQSPTVLEYIDSIKQSIN